MTQLPATADIVIVGGGVMGASTAFHLAQRGTKNVVLLEREQFFGAGATGRCAGGIRHQFATAINIELSKVSLRMLDDFEAVTGRPALVRKCGYMFVLTRAADVARFEQTIALQRSLGIQTEWLDGAQVQRRLPACRFADALGGTFFKEDGLADPNSVVMGYIDAARRLGATCHSGVSVTGIVSAGGRISAVHTNAGAISTPIVINTCGPWSAALAQMAGLALPVVPCAVNGSPPPPCQTCRQIFHSWLIFRKAFTFIAKVAACLPACRIRCRPPALTSPWIRHGNSRTWIARAHACQLSKKRA